MALNARPSLHVAATVLAALLAPLDAGAQAAADWSPRLSCVAPERLACGCQIRLQGPACTNQVFAGQPQLFTELDATAPLVLVIDGVEQVLAHAGHTGKSVKGDPPGRSTDRYQSPELAVELRYRPAPGTCPASSAEGCEYTDVRVEVRLTRAGSRPWTRTGVGKCGC